MKATQIFDMLIKNTGIDPVNVSDYRPCNKCYTPQGIPTVSDAIVVSLKNNGTVIYIPERDENGQLIVRQSEDKGHEHENDK